MVDCKMVCAYCTYGQQSKGTGGLMCYNCDSEHFMQPVHYAGYCMYYVREIDKTEHELKEALEVLSSYCSKHYHPPTDDGERGCDRDCIFINKVYGDCWFEDGESLYPEENITSLSLDEMQEWHNNKKVEGFRKFLEWRESQKEDI